MLVEPKYVKRERIWVQAVADDMQRLTDRVETIEVEQLAENDRFVTTMMQATEVALRTYEEEKLDVLRHACIHSALATEEFAEQYERAFVRYIDELSPLHLQVLAYLADPYGWFDRHAIEKQHFMAAPRLAAFALALPELHADEELRELVLRELAQRGLADTGMLSGIVSENAVYTPVVSEHGRRFLAFIAPPEEM